MTIGIEPSASNVPKDPNVRVRVGKIKRAVKRVVDFGSNLATGPKDDPKPLRVGSTLLLATALPTVAAVTYPPALATMVPTVGASHLCGRDFKEWLDEIELDVLLDADDAKAAKEKLTPPS